MERSFGSTLSELRREGDLSQRTLANDLHISQALLSHYENGTREPGLPFVCRVCDYFGVSADYILGRNDEKTAGLCFTSATTEMNKLLATVSDPTLREAALTYVDSAALRMVDRLMRPNDELCLAERSALMAASELIVVRAMTGNTASTHEK